LNGFGVALLWSPRGCRVSAQPGIGSAKRVASSDVVILLNFIVPSPPSCSHVLLRVTIILRGHLRICHGSTCGRSSIIPEQFCSVPFQIPITSGRPCVAVLNIQNMNHYRLDYYTEASTSSAIITSRVVQTKNC
jgi:hypothetical protein